MLQRQALHFSVVCCYFFPWQPVVTIVTKPICTLPSLPARRNSAVDLFYRDYTLVHISLKWADVGACKRNSETDMNTVWMETCVCQKKQNKGSRNGLQWPWRAPLAVSPMMAHWWPSLTNMHCWFSRDRVKRTGIRSQKRVTVRPAQPNTPRGPAALSSLRRVQARKCLHRKSINT